MAKFGSDFENYTEETVEETPAPAATSETPAAGGAQDKATKGKVAAKSTGLKYQFQIMETMGIKREDIKKFADPYFWTDYYPNVTRVSRL